MNAVPHHAETAFTFRCGDADLIGVLHGDATRPAPCGVVMVVGGPQYRVGAHRQYLMLARGLAEAGVPTLRFDIRGMGDSGGLFAGFEGCGDDIAAAVDALAERVPGLDRVVLWGLCDGATAAAFHMAAARDPRIAGAVLLNPWARSDRTEAAARARHYYGRRLFSAAFWRKLAGGGVALGPAVRGAAASAQAALMARLGRRRSASESGAALDLAGGAAPLPERLARAMEALPVPVCLILSGRDLTAREFEDSVLRDGAVRRRLGRGHIRLHRMPEANHTFSTEEGRRAVLGWTLDHVRTQGGAA